MTTKIDNRQLISRDALAEISGVSGVLTDALLRATDALLQPIFRMSASSTPNLTLNIAGIEIQNPQTLRSKRPAPLGISGSQLTLGSGTVVFPASSGGTATPTPGSGSTITITSNYYKKILISVNTSGNIIITQGTEATSSANATLPAEPEDTYSIGYVTLFNNAGTIANITNSNIVHFTSNKYLPTGNLVGTNDTQTLTNKTISGIIISGISGDIIPTSNNTYNLGSASFAWANGHINNLYASALEAPASTGILNIGVAAQTDLLNIGTGSDVRTINLGTGSGQTFINIGGAADFVAIAGTLTWVNTTNAAVTSQNILLNVGGAVASAQNSGIIVREGLASRTATAATWQASTQTVRLTMANTGAIAAGNVVTTSGFSNALHNGSFEVTAISANAWIEVANSGVTSSAADVTSQTASIIEPYSAAYLKLANARTSWEFSTADNQAKNFKLVSASGANSWELGASVANSVYLRPNADSTGGIFYPYNNDTQLGQTANRWSAFLSSADLSGGIKVGVASAKTSAYTATATDFVIPVNTTGGAVTITLPAAVLNTLYIVKDVGGAAATNNITIAKTGGDTIDGGASAVIDSQYMSLGFLCTASGIWSVV
jgi:hypothetical protein